jgi:outer membrane protein assembly factor BamB
MMAGEPPAAQQQQAMPGPAALQAGKGGELVQLPLPNPEPFKTQDGKSGWKLKIPGGRPLATPAVADGVLYVGGGFGSHEFYALDAKTGKAVWTCRTGDDGPTAAVVVEGCVAYNTESCTLIVHDSRTGKILWHKWLGDPLMSQPAVANGRLFMAYPKADAAEGRTHHLAAFELRTGKVLWDYAIAAEIISAPVVEGDSVFVATVDGTLWHFDAKTGKLLWQEKRNVTSAPRIADGKVYVSQRAVKTIELETKEGGKAKKSKSQYTVEGFNVADATTGKFAYDEPQASLKAAYLLTLDMARGVEMGNIPVAVAAARANQANAGGIDMPVEVVALGEGAAADVRKIAKLRGELAKSRPSEDLDAVTRDAQKATDLAKALDAVREKLEKTEKPEAKAKAEAIGKAAADIRATAEKTKEAALAAQNAKSLQGAIQKESEMAKVSDASVGFAAAPEAGNLPAAIGNIGQTTVKAVWAFQGSRPLLFGSRCIAVTGDQFRSVEAATGKVAWESKIDSKADATRPATPPALAGGKCYLGTADGRVLCVDPETGKTLWEAKVGGRILFEPAVVDGRVYVATEDGMLICLETGDPAATGWAMWGGSARHNGSEER